MYDLIKLTGSSSSRLFVDIDSKCSISSLCELDSFLIDEVEEPVDEIVVDVELDGIVVDGERNSGEIEYECWLEDGELLLLLLAMFWEDDFGIETR